MRRPSTALSCLSFLPLLSLATLAACDSTDNGTIALVTGEETDVFSQSPAATQLVVDAIDTSGNSSTLATASLPTSTVDLGTQDESNVATLEVIGSEANGTQVVAGASLGLQYGALAGGTLDLFVQRTNQWARLPSPPTDARQAPTLALLSGEFLFIGGGSDTSIAASTQLYDFAPLAPVSGPPTMPRAPLSMPVIGTVGLVIDQAGADYYDFSQNLMAACTPPSGFAFGDIAGGQVVYDYDASAQTLDAVFVVGATRTTGTATAAVLEIDATDTSNSNYPTGNLHWLTLSAPRLGAAAVWVPGRGLVVAGGSGTAAGVEILTPVSGSAVPAVGAGLAYPSDLTFGAGATTPDTQHILLAGGVTPTGEDAGVREIDLGCASNCATMGIAQWATLSTPIVDASVFILGTGNGYPALVVGNEPGDGLTHTFLLNSTSAMEVPTKVPHHYASAIQSPLAAGVLLFGGTSEIEQFMPNLSP